MKSCAVLILVAAVGCGSSNGSGGAGGEGAVTATGAGGGIPAGLDCIGNVMLPTVAAGTGNVVLALDNGLGMPGPIAGAHVVACAKDGAVCGTALAAGDTGADGSATLSVPFGPDGFDGYTIATKQGYFTTVLASSIPYVPDYGTSHFKTGTQSEIQGLINQAFGIQIDVSKGILIVSTNDCAGNPLLGATVTITGVDVGKLGYEQNGKPVADAKSTDAGGLAFAANVAPGLATVETRVAGSNELIGKGTVFVRAGAVSQISIVPTP